MSAFSLPIPPRHLAMPLHRPTERSATTSEDRRRSTEDGKASGFRFAMQALQHLRDELVLVSPLLPARLIDIAEIKAIPQPHPHLVARAERDLEEPPELRLRLLLAG